MKKKTKQKKKTTGGKTETKNKNFIFINCAGMDEISILSIPDVSLLFTFTTILKTMGVSPNKTLLLKHTEGCESEARLYQSRFCFVLFVYSRQRNFSAIQWLSPLPVTGLQI
jgi:hypothetical protein